MYCFLTTHQYIYAPETWVANFVGTDRKVNGHRQTAQPKYVHWKLVGQRDSADIQLAYRELRDCLKGKQMRFVDD
jgi:hypothetical protein